MKIKITQMLLIVILMVGSIQLSAQKLGHINSQNIIVDMPDYKSALVEFQNYQKSLQDELEMWQKLNQEKLQEYQSKMSEMTEESKQRAEADLQERFQNLEKKQYEFQTKLQEREQQIMVPIQTKLSAAIKDVSKKNGYDYIFEEASTLFAGGNDVSDLIRKHLGLSVPQK